MEELKKLKKLIEKYQNFIILFSEERMCDSAPAAMAFFYILKQLNKNTKFIQSLPSPINFILPDFTPNSSISPQTTSSEPLVYLIIGINSPESINRYLSPNSYLVNIDNQITNSNFGNLNLTQEQPSTLSELTLDIISFLDENENLFSAQTASALLSGLLNNFSHSPLATSTIQKIGFLIDHGADIKALAHQIYQSETISIEEEKAIGLCAKVLSKLNISERRNTGWALLEKETFESTDSSPKDLPFALKKLSSGMFPFQNFFLLWEQQSLPIETQGIFYSPHLLQLNKITSSFGGWQKGQGVLFKTTETNLLNVKNKILELLELP
ncbi:MAG: hypothetical protein NTZ42_03360 [Candidatus Gribaldobacteria bacterium]|nr:hypothetical protein [Candidatus Gribaldobacteria bacterium]